MNNSNLKLCNKTRIVKVFWLVRLFNKFTQLKLNEYLLNSESTFDYNSQEMFSKLFNIEFKFDPKDNDKVVNECINLNETINSLLNSESLTDVGLDKESVLSFLNHAEYGSLHILKVYHLILDSLCALYSNFYFNKISKSTLLANLDYYKNLKFPCSSLETKPMIRILQMVEKDYDEINQKRIKRKTSNSSSGCQAIRR